MPGWASLLAVLLLLPFQVAFAQTRSRSVRAAPPDASNPESWLGNNAIVISLESATDAQLSPVLGWIGSSSIVALGDGTHGTHEFYAIKGRLVEALVRAGGVRAILFEAGWPEFNRLNDYVLGRSQEDPESLLKDRAYWFWNTEEIVALARWIRQWNDTNPSAQVEIRGIDVLLHERLISEVLEMLDGVDIAAATSARTAFGCLTPGQLNYYQQPEERKQECREALRVMAQDLENRGPIYAARVGTSRYQDVLQSARLVLEAETVLAVEPLRRSGPRDQVMARNVTRIQETTGGRVIVWAHNGHLSASGNIYDLSFEFPSIGSELRQRYGDDYFAIGTASYSGQFNVFTCVLPASVLVARDIPALGEDYYEHFLHRSGAPALAFPLRGIGATWLDQPRRLWMTGHCVVNLDHSVVLPRNFDAMFFIDQSSPTRVLPF